MKISIDGFENYGYVPIYVDDVLSISDDPNKVLQKIDKYFGLKPGYLSEPNIYLGENLKPTSIENGVVAWYLIPLQYIQEGVKNTYQYVKENIG